MPVDNEALKLLLLPNTGFNAILFSRGYPTDVTTKGKNQVWLKFAGPELVL
jgi:hypothetical protein